MPRKRAEGECSRCGEYLEFQEEWGKEPADGDYSMELMEVNGADYIDGELVCEDCASKEKCSQCEEWHSNCDEVDGEPICDDCATKRPCDECGERFDEDELTSVNNWGELCEDCNPDSCKNREARAEKAQLEAELKADHLIDQRKERKCEDS